MDVPYTMHPGVGNTPPSGISSEERFSAPRSPRRQSRKERNAPNSSEYALSGPSVTARLQPSRSKLPNNPGFYDHESAPEASPLAKILQLRRDQPWVGDTLSPADTERSYHALTSMVLAFALYADISGEQLPDLMLAALQAQDGRPATEGIDQGVVEVLRKLGFDW